MGDKVPKSPFNSQKKFSKYNKFTVDTIRNEIRTEFKQRIQSQRSKHLDSQRCITEEDLQNLVKESAEDIKNMVILDGQEDINSILNLVDEVQQEVLQEEQQTLGNIYEKELELEVTSLLPKCISCQKIREGNISSESFLCQDCSVGFVE